MKLELNNITKRFGQFIANDAINLTVNPGEIHALLGENGAGKSTLMNVLYGLYQAEEGDILLDGKKHTFNGPGDAMRAGIGMVHQHFMLVPVFTVAENVALGHERSTVFGKLDINHARAQVIKISERFGFNVDPDAKIEDLPVGIQQRVEIIKALALDAKVLVFDEPTAVLTPQETDELINVMKQLRDEGRAIIFISHKLREIKEIADKITVIRLGKVVGTALPSASNEELASLMVGRPVNLTVNKSPLIPSEIAFKVTNLKLSDKNIDILKNISFSVTKGEVFAIAGVQGNGQTELIEAIMGLRPEATGEIELNKNSLKSLSINSILNLGVGYVPEDRHRDAMVSNFTISENLMLDRTQDSPFVKNGTIDFDLLHDFAKQKIEEYDIRSQGHLSPIGTLSGGNQQKVILAREMSKALKLLVISQPTRGLDVGSIEFIHKQIIKTRDSGIPVIVVSTELDEVYAIADTIAVMHHGEIMGIVDSSTPRETIGMMMAGLRN
ncbi:ABC transporter ATP-binding protein [Thorsellia anophelis]|uniref:Simple sugar transport system ATP-binding protein n=1 Tax=Thorsellia anophelis DSM 18579 TaxID=1123402 RepID=A0A1H9ZNV5_9GAMM|nr:ABC transporter ATP-binding protein [Thorsellia anophelis]SES83414.1 simple sugar transport system ATP-binding protein [Thorsellia anophelis DSM 18579]